MEQAEVVTDEQITSNLENLLIGKSNSEEPEEEAVEETVESDEAKAEEKTEETPEPDDSEEVEYDGDVYVMPKKIKEALLRQSDYTKKTQEVAEQRKAVEERAEWLSQQERLMAAGFEKAVELKEIDARLAQYEQLDWQALVDQDPAQATKLNISFQQLQRQRAGKVEELQKHAAENQRLTQETRQKMLAQGAEQVKKAIPSWNAELAKAISDNTKSYGFTDKELDQLTDPRFVVALHDAHQWRKLQASKSTVQKKVADVKSVTPTARTSQSTQSDAKLKEARQRMAKTGSTQDTEAFFERLLTSKRK